jgi:malonyl-CoA/methylmalonyl-CoA synthetase
MPDLLDWLTQPDRQHRPFLETPDGLMLNYADFGQRVASMAGGLISKGVEPGDRVTAQLEKSVEGLTLYFACLWAGAVFMPLNTGYTEAELDYFLTDAEPRLFIAEHGTRAGQMTMPELLAAQDQPAPRHAASADDLAAMCYTSGTTGKPKGAMISRGSLAANAQTLVSAWHFTAEDVLIHALPIYHVHGLFVATNTVLAAGASMLFRPKFDADDVLALMPRASVLMGVPTFYTRLLTSGGLTKAACATMRLFVSGSAPLLAETHQAFEAQTGHAILERYGMTETLMNTSNPYMGSRIPGTVGPPLPGVDLKIVDPETGAPLRDGEIGMIVLKGANLFKGYWRNPQKTAEDMRADGFFITGDLGRIDEKGYVHIVGRGKDLIISGGLNIYPKEIETALNALPSIIESAVIGVPHADFGEGVVGVVVADGPVDHKAILGALGKELARFKLPKAIIAVDALPRNAMGKVQKNVLRDQYAGLLID